MKNNIEELIIEGIKVTIEKVSNGPKWSKMKSYMWMNGGGFSYHTATHCRDNHIALMTKRIKAEILDPEKCRRELREGWQKWDRKWKRLAAMRYYAGLPSNFNRGYK